MIELFIALSYEAFKLCRFLVVGLVWLGVWLDSLGAKRLPAFLDNYDELTKSPMDVLSRAEVRIGPGYRKVTATLFGTIFGFSVVWLTSKEVFGIGSGDLNTPAIEQLLLWAVCLAGSVFCSFLFLRLSRGGEIVLRADGVSFCHGKSIVVCTWPMFWVHGQAVEYRHFRLCLPANPNEIHDIRMEHDGVSVAPRIEVSTNHFRFRPNDEPRLTNGMRLPEILIDDRYEVSLEEVGTLILMLGNSLGPIIDNRRSTV